MFAFSKKQLISILSFFLLLFLFIYVFIDNTYGQYEDLPELTQIALIPGENTTCVAVDNQYAYIGERSRNKIHIFDISTPESPLIISSINVSNPTDIILKDNNAYIAGRQEGLTILDIENPYEPILISRYDTLEYCCKVFISGNYLFATNRGAGLEIINITNPENPQFISKVYLGGECQGIKVVDRFAYVSQWYEKRVIILDVSDIRFPEIVATVPLEGYGQGLDVSNDLLCVATGEKSPNSISPGDGCGMDIYNVANPYLPTHLSTVKVPPYTTGPDLWTAKMSGQYVLLTGGIHGVYIFDISDPLNPIAVSHITVNEFASNLSIKEGYIFVCDTGDLDNLSGLKIYQTNEFAFTQVDNPAFPFFISSPPSIDLPSTFSQIHANGQTRSAAVIDDKIIVAAGEEGLRIYETEPNFELNSTFISNDLLLTRDVSTLDDNIFLAESNGLKILNLNNSNEIQLINSYGSSAYNVVAFKGNRVVLAVNQSRIHILDTSDLQNLVLLDNIYLPHFIRQICPTIFKQHYTCVSHTNGFTIIDLTGIESPITVFTACNGGVVYENDKAILGYFSNPNNDELQIYDLSQNIPTLISTISLPDLNIDFSGTLSLFSSKLFLTSWNTGAFAIIDIKDPYLPIVDNIYNFNSNCGTISFRNNQYFIPNGREGVLVYSPRETVYEDAENSGIANWSIYDNDPIGAEISNVYDELRQSNVIKLNGSGTANGYHLSQANGCIWNNSEQFVLEWSMKFQQKYTVYVDVQTTSGRRLLTYKPVDIDALGNDKYVYHGLGSNSIDGIWRTFTRDLKSDLDEAQPSNTLLAVNGFYIRGSGIIDDVKLLQSIPIYENFPTVYEDAEDNDIANWSIYDNDPTGAEISNVYDDDRQSRVIKFNGIGTANGYHLSKADGSNWANSEQFILEWSMKFSSFFTVYVVVETTVGERYLTYKPVDYNNLGDGLYVYHGLGSDAYNGQWNTFERNLQEDLFKAQSDAQILEVNGFSIRGDGFVDDIILKHE